MYKIPKNLPTDQIKGATLIQVCVGENEIILNMSSDVSITVMSSIKWVNGEESIELSYRDIGWRISEFLGCRVDSLLLIDELRLRMFFADGVGIEICDDSDQYESFIISAGREKFVA